jgi:hypothetical protein
MIPIHVFDFLESIAPTIFIGIIRCSVWLKSLVIQRPEVSKLGRNLTDSPKKWLKSINFSIFVCVKELQETSATSYSRNPLIYSILRPPVFVENFEIMLIALKPWAYRELVGRLYRILT